MDVKGQASAEYLLLVLVFLIILGSVTIPLIAKSINYSMDVSKTSDASAAVNSIANEVGLVYANGPGSIRTINIYSNANGTMSVNANNVLILPVTLSDSTIKNINASLPYSATINPSNPYALGNHTNYNVTVSWPVGTNTIQINLTQT